ncbi:hypothetical protein NX794_03930 [Streptomyces sp. LP11]|uniref:Uncharacterized protein n=1 Tax=Streptomyces pyxinicus TaxID=2970331 RepID=A0ABT2AVU9_9ACTN|nr:hypothetical protein [Streptomyces sp. LP11]MCS0600383.1 hypothetical protein [Streptomyces sp. LP11]
MGVYKPLFPGNGTVMEETWIKVHGAGEVRGEARGMAKAVLRVLDAGRLKISEGVRNQIMDCSDQRMLETPLDLSLAVTNGGELLLESCTKTEP